jgi:putative addiction module killer protein/probable addiction module antidote protein
MNSRPHMVSETMQQSFVDNM